MRVATVALLLILAGCGSAPRRSSPVRSAEVQGTRDATWASSASEFRRYVGWRVAYHCPPGGTAHSVWGSGPYTDDSSVCTAAVHAGALTLARGGRVVIEIQRGRDTYYGSHRQGITTLDYGVWGGSFVVVRE
ncbi:MAG TPA: LCCL domain-containing protein [Rubricoccaceae bacterium]|nr:LCCL domain-containing protein [Rubricoccaceae bacterium]